MPSTADSGSSRRPGRSAAARFFTNSTTGQLAVVQRPNAPLAIFLAASAVRVLTHPQGTAGAAVAIVGGAALLVWSGLEITRGDSPFRRVLGAVVLVVTVAGLLGR